MDLDKSIVRHCVKFDKRISKCCDDIVGFFKRKRSMTFGANFCTFRDQSSSIFLFFESILNVDALVIVVPTSLSRQKERTNSLALALALVLAVDEGNFLFAS